MIAPFLDVYRVDIKGFSEETYLRIGHTRDLQGVFEGTRQARALGMHVEIVSNIIPGYNDAEEELRGIATWIRTELGPEIPWHVTRFHPHFKLDQVPSTPVSTLERAWALGKEAGLWYVYLGNVAGHRLENTYCHGCGELLIERYVFDILANRIRDGACPACRTVIPGRF
jgi:pyruvate formate lyase activating enzyme